MPEPRTSRRVISVTVLVALFGGGYYAIEHFGNRPADEQSSAAGKATLSGSQGPEERAEKHQSGVNSYLETLDEGGHAFPDTEGGLEAFQPAKLYSKYVDEADDGNLHAQYVLVTALEECRHGAATRDEIAELERSGLSADVLQAVEARFQRCEPLYNALPNLEEEYQRRYRAARDSKHPLILVKQRGVPVDEKRRVVAEAISQRYPEAHLYASAFMEAAILHREYPEKLDILREEAWLMLYCEASFHCDSQKELRSLAEKYHPHEYEEIIANHASITTAIEQRDWDALGL